MGVKLTDGAIFIWIANVEGRRLEWQISCVSKHTLSDRFMLNILTWTARLSMPSATLREFFANCGAMIRMLKYQNFCLVHKPQSTMHILCIMYCVTMLRVPCTYLLWYLVTKLKVSYIYCENNIKQIQPSRVSNLWISQFLWWRLIMNCALSTRHNKKYWYFTFALCSFPLNYSFGP